jgi:hypothetical protein
LHYGGHNVPYVDGVGCAVSGSLKNEFAMNLVDATGFEPASIGQLGHYPKPSLPLETRASCNPSSELRTCILNRADRPTSNQAVLSALPAVTQTA